MMKKTGVDYIICAAGDGLRLQAPDFKIPKPLIQLKGQSLLERSLESLSLDESDQLIIVTQKNHGVAASMSGRIQKLFPKVHVRWIEITQRTSGQLETAMLAEKFLRGAAVAIFNSDTYFSSGELSHLLLDSTVDGIIPCCQESGNEWSFCRIGSDEVVLEVAEKKRISNYASVGFYSFKDSATFLKYAAAEIASCKKLGIEAFVAPLYNRMIADRMKVVMDLVQEFKPMGTPEQLQKYWNFSTAEMIEENTQKKFKI